MNTKYMVRETLRSGCGMGLNMRLIYDQEHGSLAASPLHTAHHEVYVQVHVHTVGNSKAGRCTAPNMRAAYVLADQCHKDYAEHKYDTVFGKRLTCVVHYAIAVFAAMLTCTAS